MHPSISPGAFSNFVFKLFIPNEKEQESKNPQ